MDNIHKKILAVPTQVAESFGFAEPPADLIELENKSDMRLELIRAAANAGEFGRLDAPILNGDLLNCLSGDAVINKEIDLDIPIDTVIGIANRLFCPAGTTWREAVKGLHCRGWDGYRLDIINYFEGDFSNTGGIMPGSSGHMQIAFVGNLPYCKMGNHRVVAARAWLASRSLPCFKKASTSFYNLREPVKIFFQSCLKNNVRIEYYLAPYVQPQAAEDGYLSTDEQEFNISREQRINNSHKLFKKLEILLILKTETDSATVSYKFIRSRFQSDSYGFAPVFESISLQQKVLLNKVLEKLPFTELSPALISKLISDPFVADRIVAPESPVPHPNGLQGNVFGLMPAVATSAARFLEGPIFLPRGDTSGGFGLEAIVKRFGHVFKQINTTCVHTEAILFVSELLAPGAKVYPTTFVNILKVVNPAKGTAFVHYDEKSPYLYTVTKISRRKKTLRDPIGSIDDLS